MAAAYIHNNLSMASLQALIEEEANKIRASLAFKNDFAEMDFAAIDKIPEPVDNKYFWDASGIFYGNKKEEGFKNMIQELNRLSWIIFELNKIGCANSIDLFSPRTAFIFDLANTLTNNVKFISERKYINNSFEIGTLDNRYKVYLHKQITRTVLNEKTKTSLSSESFILEKWDTIELYNDNAPDKRICIKIENLHL